ncbi:MAG: glutathione S-transferase [Betaproteobacteria bacterium SG8_39]|nr:MAG: glutathione S-transferase [Betaproteobacteria bacterium SG8_39]
MNTSATFELTLTRSIRAPREKVFDAFVTPALMKAWMCPRGMTVPEASADPRPGGRFSVTMLARDGDRHTAAGVYREVKRPERLVYTWQWQNPELPNVETLITVALTERDGATELRMTHSGFPDAGLRDAHNAGWNASLNQLVERFDERGTAANVTLLGDSRSTYTRTVRMGLAEKGVRYRIETAGPKSAEVAAIHPFARIPAFRDGDLQLFETSAILRYVEEAFPGPSLLPGNIRDRARCEQWVSAINAYCYDAMVRRYVLPYLFPKGADGKPDRSVIDPALPEISRQLARFDAAYGEKNLLAGASVSLADLFLAPILAYVAAMPEGKELMTAVPNVARAQAAMRERASFKDTEPAR